MSHFVLDASVALAWCFRDEATPKSAALLDSLDTTTAHAPALWTLEVGNVLAIAERKKRITYAHIAEFFALLQNLNIQIDHETAARGFHDIFSLAHKEKLTTYDAAYLELAMRLGLPLATKDELLAKAAKRVGVMVFQL